MAKVVSLLRQYCVLHTSPRAFGVLYASPRRIPKNVDASTASRLRLKKVISMKLRADLYRREAGELLRNISMYPGLSETQLCRFFPGKEDTVHTLLARMVHTGRAILSADGRYFANVEQLEQHDSNSSRAVWVLLDLFPQVEYHAAAEFPAMLLCFAGGQAIEIVCVPIRHPGHRPGGRCCADFLANCRLYLGFLHCGCGRSCQLLPESRRSMNREKLYDRIMLEHRNLIQIHKKLYEAQHLPVDSALDEVADLLTDAALLAEKSTCRLRNLLFDTAPIPRPDYFSRR